MPRFDDAWLKKFSEEDVQGKGNGDSNDGNFLLYNKSSELITEAK